MLIGVDPLLTGSVLCLLDELGHGDTVAVVDGNYPLCHCPGNRVDGDWPDAAALCRALARHVPMQGRLRIMEHPDEVHAGVQEMVDGCSASGTLEVERLEREPFYAAVASVGLVLRTRDQRPYGNVVITRGVV